MSLVMLTPAELIGALVALLAPAGLGLLVGLQIGIPGSGATAGVLAGLVLMAFLFGDRLRPESQRAARGVWRRG